MKEKIITLIIGILIGAIIATGGFYIYNKNHQVQSSSNSTSGEGTDERKGQRPEMNGEKPDFENGEKPSKSGLNRSNSETTNTENQASTSSQDV